MSLELTPSPVALQSQRQRVSAWLRRWFGPRVIGSDAADAVVTALGLAPEEAAAARFRVRVAANPRALDAALRALLDDETAAVAPRLIMRSATGDASMPEVLSLGTHCYTSALMRRWGLRRAAGPFDWLFSSVPMLTHALDDDFQVFLDRAHYEPVPPSQRPAGPTSNRVQHAYYREHFGVEYVFNHHDAHLDEDYAHFVRAVHRFRDSLSNTSRKLFLLTRWQSLGFEQELPALCQALAQRTTNFKLLVFAVGGVLRTRTGTDLRRVDDGSDPRLAAYRVDPLSHWKPLEFENFADELPIAGLIAQHLSALMHGYFS